MKSEIRIIGAGDVTDILENREMQLLNLVSQAYLAHYEGKSSLPHSVFLRFPHLPTSRIISLPSYLGGPHNLAGMKWIASFPGNKKMNLPRASAVIALNDMETGFPIALMEASVISAKRTAASAALAAKLMHGNSGQTRLGLIGAGPINYEILRFLKAVFPRLADVDVLDLSGERAAEFSRNAESEFDLDCRIAGGSDEVFARNTLVSLATTAGVPHIGDASGWPSDMTVLNVSLRDLAPAVILACENYVDDLEHVCRERTSIELAFQEKGNTGFVRGTLETWLRGGESRTAKPHIFSPFGLGILDLAVAKHVLEEAREKSMGHAMENFLPLAGVAV